MTGDEETIKEKKPPEIKFINKGIELVLYIGEFENIECLIKKESLLK